MADRIEKADFEVSGVRRYLEPGPIVLVSSAAGDERNVMTLGWQTVMEFAPSLVGCMISAGNHSFGLVRDSGECVINLPTAALIDEVVGIGNTSGRDVDKFARFGLTPEPADRVSAPLIAECHASFECVLQEAALVDSHNFFVFEVVKAHVAPEPAHPRTIHYTGGGVFMLSGETVDKSDLFRPDMLV